MTYTTMWAYPWDLLDDGAHRVARRLREDIGLDAVSVATSYHSVEHLRPHTRGSRMFVAHEGAVYFQPDPQLWKSAPIRPNVAPLAATQNPLEVICAAAERAGLNVESWTVCLHNSALGRRHPTAVVENAFGDGYVPALCPSNPDVRLYITTLIRDLATNYPLFAIELESLYFDGFGHFHGHEKVGVELGNVGRFLLSLCFCPSCSRRAEDSGVDIAGLRGRVRSTVAQILQQGAPLALHADDLLAEDDDLRALLALREGIVTSLAHEVKEAAGDKFLVAMVMGDPRVTGANGKALAELADALEVLCYTAQTDVLEQAVSQATTQYCAADDLIVGLSAFVPHTPSKGVLTANVRRALDMGVRGFSFYNYGIMPERNLDWVASAVEMIRAAV
jgi:hypothetical protein